MTKCRVFIYCLVGNVLEWYDFALFGVLSPLLSKIFFPQESKSVALILTLAIFATAFVMRPLGAVFFGHIGDKYGRKNAVVLSIMMMTIATTAIGLLPIAIHHALAMVIVLVMLRILQGFSVSGVCGGVPTFLSEIVTDKKRFFFYQSFIYSGQAMGILLGVLVGTLAFSFHHQYAFSWRIPFLLSLLLGGMGLYLRLKAIETPVFQMMLVNKSLTTLPIATLTIKHGLKLILCIALIVSASTIFYFIAVAFPVYASHIVAGNGFLKIQSIMMLLIIIAMSFFCYWTHDKNCLQFILFGYLIFTILPLPLIWIVTYYHSAMILALAGIVLALCLGCWMGAFGTFTTIIFPNNVRYTGVAVSSNIAVLFGGAFPLLSTVLVKATGNLLASVAILSTLSLVAAALLIYFRQSLRVSSEFIGD